MILGGRKPSLVKSLRVIGATLTLMHAASATVSAGNDWTLKEFQTPNYTLIMDSESAAGVLLGKLAALEKLLDTLVAHDAEIARIPTTILVLPWDRWKEHVTREYYESWYLPLRFSNFLLLNGYQKGAGLRNTAYEEYTRVYLRAKYPGRLPFWYEHGLSSLMYSATIGRDEATIGKYPFGRYEGVDGVVSFDSPQVMPRLVAGTLLGLEEWSMAETNRRGWYLIGYQCWTWVHRGVFEPEFAQRTAAYMEQIDRLRPLPEAVRHGFGLSLDEMDKEMAAYEKKGAQLATRRTRFDPASPVEIGSVRTLKAGEILILLAGAFQEGGYGTNDIERLAGSAGKHWADASSLRILELRIAAASGDDTAVRRALAEIDTNPVDPARGRSVALALMQRLHSDDPRSIGKSPELLALSERAFVLLDRSLNVNPQDPEAAWAYALLAGSMKRNLDVAATRLVAARKDLPRNPDIAVAAALLAEARGEKASIAPNLVEVLRFSRRKGQREWAARQLAAHPEDTATDGKQ